jgi:ATP-dependent Lon protease
MVLPIVVRGEESRKLVDEAMGKDRRIGILVSKKKELKVSPKPGDLYTVGTVA